MPMFCQRRLILILIQFTRYLFL